jgi:hypothetical protein
MSTWDELGRNTRPDPTGRPDHHHLHARFHTGGVASPDASV